MDLNNEKKGEDSFDEFSHEALEDELYALESEKGAAKKNYFLVALLVVLFGAVAFMMFDGFKSETYFYTVDEAMAKGDAIVGETIRVKGVVEPGSVVGKEGELGRSFRLTEKGKTIAVTYDRAMPDTFKEDMEVIVHGKVGEDYVLVADEVLVKCPSRYEGMPPGMHPKSVPTT